MLELELWINQAEGLVPTCTNPEAFLPLIEKQKRKLEALIIAVIEDGMWRTNFEES